MSEHADPLALFPKDGDGRVVSGFSRAFPHWQIEEALRNGWVRMEPNCAHPLDQYGDWLWHFGNGPVWLPEV